MQTNDSTESLFPELDPKPVEPLEEGTPLAPGEAPPWDEKPVHPGLFSHLTEFDALCKALQEVDDDGEPVFSDAEVDSALDAYLAGNAPLQAKIEGYVRFARDRDMWAERYKAEADVLTKLKRREERIVTRLRDRLTAFAKATAGPDGKWKVQTEHVSLSLNNAGGKLPVQYVNEDAIPLEYCAVTVPGDMLVGLLIELEDLPGGDDAASRLCRILQAARKSGGVTPMRDAVADALAKGPVPGARFGERTQYVAGVLLPKPKGR